ncbi:unnamed protein product [Heterobilharzia americana]|nr:unnamed protein product [Heterobilharzia americana]
MDTENLESTKKEISVTRKRLEGLTSKRNELFQRLKQIASEETSLREKQKSETMAYLASMPSTRFGLDSNNTGSSNRITVPQTTLTSCVPLQAQTVQHVSVPKSNLNTNGPASIPHNNSGTISGSPSPHRPHHPSLYNLNGSKTTMSTPGSLSMQQPLTTVSNNSSTTMAAVVAAVAAQQRSMPSSDPGFPPTAAAAAYFNVIASLANSPSLTGNSLGIAYPNSSVSLAEVVAALAASGLCSLPASLSSNPIPMSSGNMTPNFAFGNRASPSNPDGHQIRDTMTTLSSGTMHPGLTYLQNPMQSTNLSKHPAVSIHHNTNFDLGNATLDTAKVCLAQIAAVAAAGSNTNNNNINNGSYMNHQNILSNNQQLQKAHQILRSLNASNTLISPLLGGNTSDLDVSQNTSTTTSTTVSSSPLLPPAPISYRGSITTGQSAQQIQLQQQAHQKQQHNMPKYMTTQIDYNSTRGSSGVQNIENPHLLPSNYPINISSTQGNRQQQQQQQQINANNLIMLNLASSNHNNMPNNAGKSLTGVRHIDNSSLRNSNNVTSTPIHFNPSSSSSMTSLTSNIPTVTSAMSNSASSVALAAGLAPFAADLNSLNYLTSATLAAAFQQQQQQQQQQQLNKFMSTSNAPSSSTSSSSSSSHPHASPSGPSNNSGRRFF